MKTLSFPKGPALREVVENIATAEGGALVPLGPSLADDAAAIGPPMMPLKPARSGRPMRLWPLAGD